MFEGQNIHLSPIDGKRLCSYSAKICKQHRLNGYAFCIRHILEDQHSPFKRCQYKTKASGEKCANPVPEADDRIYCNSHLQVLNMLPRNPNKHNKKKLMLKNKNKKDYHSFSKKLSQSTEKETNNQHKVSKTTQKILEEDCTKVSKHKTNWYAVMTKVVKQTAYNLHAWRKQGIDSEVRNFLVSRKYQKQNQEFFRVHVIDDCDDSGDDGGSVDVFQSMFLDTSERVHHNLLRVDSPLIQEQKMFLKLKHCNGQMKQVVASNIERDSLSYSVLSTLVASARKSALQTANVLNVESGTTSFGSFRLYRERKDRVSYQVPCVLRGEASCGNKAMPYSKYCCDHIFQDADQHLFSGDMEASLLNNPRDALDFLRGGDVPPSPLPTTSTSTSSNQCKRKGDVPPVTQSKRSNQRLKPNVEEKRLKKKKSKTKKRPSKRSVNSIRDEMAKKFNIPAQPVQKINAHLNIPAQHVQRGNTHFKKGIIEENLEVCNKPEELSNSNSEDDDDNDILTPEEAFHLPPGSLSFSPRMVDDDSMPTIQNRNCPLDDDDDELIRCNSNNFPFESSNQLPRDIGSPTLNQLSSSDFVSSFNNIFMSPTKTLDPPPPVPINPSKTDYQQSFSTAVSKPVISPSINNRLANQPITGIANNQKSSSTVLKISSVDMFNKSGKLDHNALYNSSKQVDDRNVRSSSFNPLASGGAHDKTISKQWNVYGNNGMSSVNTQQMAVRNDPGNSYTHMVNGIGSRSHNIPIKESISYDQTSLSKCYLSDTLLMQQPLSQDNTLFDDINTDVESPLEKVNPDIFFSSVFPVATSTASI